MIDDIAKAVEIIDQRILKLQRIKADLLSEFGGELARGNPAQMRLIGEGPRKAPMTGPTRKDELVHFLREHGPSKRHVINTTSGIPRGTVANLLNQGDTFVRRSDGTWDVRQTNSAPQEMTQ
jgi:hypothetical protein